MSKNKYVLVVLAVFGIVDFATAQGLLVDNSIKLEIKQKVNHFDENDSRTWKMRCMANAEFFYSDGPLFLYVSEMEIDVETIQFGHIYDMAEEHGGYLVTTETRFYGESRPVADLSSENLKYLNVDQILADLAVVIRTIKSTTPGMRSSKVILCGKHIAGSYVTWFKQRYPELADGVWASSAPLEVKHNFFEFKEVAGQAIEMFGGPECYNRIKRAFDELQSMIDNNRIAEVRTKFHVCDSNRLDNWLDVSILMETIETVIFLLLYGISRISNVCKLIMEEPSDVDAIAAYTLRTYSYITNGKCLVLSYGSHLKKLQRTSFKRNMNRQFFYQQCNELFSFRTSDSVYQPFGTKPSLEFFTTKCSDLFGTEYTIKSVGRKIRDFNERFGGRNPKVNNVFFTYGQYDPNRWLGIEDERKATIVLNQGICDDMNKDVNNENVETVRQAVSAFVRKVLKQNYKS